MNQSVFRFSGGVTWNSSPQDLHNLGQDKNPLPNVYTTCFTVHCITSRSYCMVLITPVEKHTEKCCGAGQCPPWMYKCYYSRSITLTRVCLYVCLKDKNIHKKLLRRRVNLL